MPEAGVIAFRRIEREPLHDLAHSQLREALLAGGFEPGASLTLRALAESFGISITPARDAVTRLVAQGVLQSGPRNSAIVPHLTASELRHITTVRCALEGRAAREAAGNPDPHARAALATRLATMRKLIKDRKLESYLDHHRKFHFGIYAMSDNPDPGRHDREFMAAVRTGAVLCDPAIRVVAEGLGSPHRGAERNSERRRRAGGSRNRRRHHRGSQLSRPVGRRDRPANPSGEQVKRCRPCHANAVTMFGVKRCWILLVQLGAPGRRRDPCFMAWPHRAL